MNLKIGIIFEHLSINGENIYEILASYNYFKALNPEGLYPARKRLILEVEKYPDKYMLLQMHNIIARNGGWCEPVWDSPYIFFNGNFNYEKFFQDFYKPGKTIKDIKLDWIIATGKKPNNRFFKLFKKLKPTKGRSTQ